MDAFASLAASWAKQCLAFRSSKTWSPTRPILVTSYSSLFFDIERNPCAVWLPKNLWTRDSSQCFYVIGRWWLVNGIGCTANKLCMQDTKLITLSFHRGRYHQRTANVCCNMLQYVASPQLQALLSCELFLGLGERNAISSTTRCASMCAAAHWTWLTVLEAILR